VNLSILGLATVIVTGSVCLLVISAVALIAAVHRDSARRADAAHVLDRLLRTVERRLPRRADAAAELGRRAETGGVEDSDAP
jgi:hypothetical protein